MYGITDYLYTSIFGPDKTLYITKEEIMDAKNKLKKTGIDLTE